MTTLHLKILIPENRELKIELPEDFPVGEAQVTIEVSATQVPWNERPWTEEEIAAALEFHPVAAHDLKTGGWEDMGIEDGDAFIQDLRRKAREERGWQTFS